MRPIIRISALLPSTAASTMRTSDVSPLPEAIITASSCWAVGLTGNGGLCMFPLRVLRVPALLLCAAAAVFAQPAAKRPLNHRDYDSWRSIQGQILSRDGKFLAYSLFPEEG